LYCTFTLRQGICMKLSLNNQLLPIAQCVRYLGIHIDSRGKTWLPHIKNKVQSLNIRPRLLRPLLTFKNIKLPNKLLIYKLLQLRPIWTYGIQLWGCIKNFQHQTYSKNSVKNPSYLSKVLFYVSNKFLHSNLKIFTAIRN